MLGLIADKTKVRCLYFLSIIPLVYALNSLANPPPTVPVEVMDSVDKSVKKVESNEMSVYEGSSSPVEVQGGGMGLGGMGGLGGFGGSYGSSALGSPGMAGGFPFASKDGGGFGASMKAPENVDPKWYLENDQIPPLFKSIIDEDEEALGHYTYLAHKNCVEMRDGGLIKFFEDNIQPFIRTKPKVCEAFVHTQTEKTVPIFVDEGNGVWNQKNVPVKYDQYQFTESALDRDELSDTEKYIFDKLKEQSNVGAFGVGAIEYPADAKQQSSELSNLTVAQYITAPREMLLGANSILVKTMLLRLWDHLNLTQKMEALNTCPPLLQLNQHSGFWQTESRGSDKEGDSYDHFLKICQAKSMEELLPYLDQSIMAEYALYSGNSPSIANSIIPMCLSWPEAQTVTPKRLPATNFQKVLFNGAETLRSSNFQYNSRFDPFFSFNKTDDSSLTPEQLTALKDYTGNGYYDAINAYEMWGRLGVHMVERNREKQQEEWKMPKRENYEDVLEYEEAMVQYLRNQSEDDEIDLMTTGSGVPLSQTRVDLRSALDSLDSFEGITFGGHQLSGHLFKGLRIREGATFSPGFFMSTSTEAQTAHNFLGIHRASPMFKGTEDDEESRRNPNEAVTGYLFVIKNRTGTPIGNYSQYRGEKEVLVHPDARFKILKVETLEIAGEEYPNAQVVYLEELE